MASQKKKLISSAENNTTKSSPLQSNMPSFTATASPKAPKKVVKKLKKKGRGFREYGGCC